MLLHETDRGIGAIFDFFMQNRSIPRNYATYTAEKNNIGLARII